MGKLNENINRIKKLMRIQENKQVYPYGCVMLYFDDSDVRDIYNQINPDDLYIEEDGFGLETEPHCTLLYGLHPEVSLDEVREAMRGRSFAKCVSHNASLFENEKYDVLKYDVEGDNLHETNEILKQFPYTTDYPDYHPHMTIAYLKPGMGKKYVDVLGGEYGKFDMKPTHIVYSQTDGTKNKIEIS